MRHVFEVGQRAGLNVLPAHFYSSIPDIRELRRSEDWRKPFDMKGVRGADPSEQIAFLEEICPPALTAAWPRLNVYGKAEREQDEAGGYGLVEAHVLFAFVVHHRPSRIVQVGCGLSTSVILRAAATAGYRPDIVCIDPYPSRFLSGPAASPRITVIAERAEHVPRERLTSLGRGDLLFIDSTHAVRPGGEVNRIILDVLPRLAEGVVVHFHDIVFPFDYQRALLSSELFFSSESTLLHAYLADNARCRILFSLSMLHYALPDRLRALIPDYRPQPNADGLAASEAGHFPSAVYLQMDAPPFPG